MEIKSSLTPLDVTRADAIPPTPAIMEAGYRAQLIATIQFVDTTIAQPIRELLSKNEREVAFISLYFRMLALGKTAARLGRPYDFQTLIAGTRSILELAIDIELLHRNSPADGVIRLSAFTQSQRLKAAERIVNFYELHPTLDSTPSSVDGQRDFVSKNKANIEAAVTSIWGTTDKGRPNFPKLHWTSDDLLTRAQKLSPEWYHRTIMEYDLRNFMTHTGMAGAGYLDRDLRPVMTFRAFRTYAELIPDATRTICKELQLDKAVMNLPVVLNDLQDIYVWAMANAKLVEQGEPSRLHMEPMATWA